MGWSLRPRLVSFLAEASTCLLRLICGAPLHRARMPTYILTYFRRAMGFNGSDESKKILLVPDIGGFVTKGGGGRGGWTACRSPPKAVSSSKLRPIPKSKSKNALVTPGRSPGKRRRPTRSGKGQVKVGSTIARIGRVKMMDQ